MGKSIISTWGLAIVIACLASTAFGQPASLPPPEPLGNDASATTATTGREPGTGAANSAAGIADSPEAAEPGAVSNSSSPAGTKPPAVANKAAGATKQPLAAASLATPKEAHPKQPKSNGPIGFWNKCKEPEGEAGGSLSTDCSGVFGLRTSVTRVNNAASHDSVGIMIQSQGEEYVRRGFWTARTLHQFAIGGGAAGFEGTLLGGWAGGVRLPVDSSRRHGPLARLGMYGYLRGNDAWYGSLLELPQLQVGYQYQNGKTVLELGATTGAVLTGRARIGDAERRVLGTGFEYGGYAAVQLPWLRLGLSVQRLPVDDTLANPVDVAEGTLCGHAGGFAVCTDARATFTHAMTATNTNDSELRSLYAGITVGFTRE